MASSQQGPVLRADGRREGVVPLAERASRLISGSAWRAGCAWMHGYRMAPAAAAAMPPGIDVRPLREEEVVALAADPRFHLVEREIHEAYATGSRCIAAYADAAPAGFAWLAPRVAAHDTGRVVRVPEGVQYRYKVLVLPEFRGRGIATALYRHANAGLAAEGARCAMLFIAPHNVASVRAALAAGGRRVGLVVVPTNANLPAWHSRPVRAIGVRFARGEVMR